MKTAVTMFDIETTNLKGTFGRVLCASFADLGKREVVTLRADDYPGEDWADDSKLVAAIKEYLEDCWIWCGWYSKMFDVPFLNARLILHGMSPLEKRMHIDLYYYSKGQFMKIHSSKLDSIAKSFQLKAQKTDLLPHVWVNAMKGDKDALENVVKHCEADVRVLRQAFPILCPFIKNIHV